MCRWDEVQTQTQRHEREWEEAVVPMRTCKFELGLGAWRDLRDGSRNSSIDYF